MNLLLIRHGETEGNLLKHYIGRTDEPLCEQGREHAGETRGRFSCPGTGGRVYVSPLLRATQTAIILFPQAEQIVVEDFREMDFGDFEGHSHEELQADATYRAWLDKLCEPPCPNGESRAEFNTRVRSAFSSLIEEALRTQEKHVAIVAHGGTIMSIMGHGGRPSRPFYEWSVKNCGGYRITLKESQWRRVDTFTSWEKQ
jgi:alpha-ribazole phosphatase